MRQLALCFAVCLFGACGSNEVQPDITKSHIDSSKVVALPDTLHRFDTFQIKGKTVVFQSIPKTEFEQAKDVGFYLDENRNMLNLQDSSFLSRRDSTILIHCKNGIIVPLTGTNSMEGGGFVYYEYKGRLPGSPFAVFLIEYYEGGDYLIVNLDTGVKKKISFGKLYFSSDSHILFNASQPYGNDCPPIQMYILNEDSLSLCWEHSFCEWDINPAKWTNNRTILIKQTLPVSRGRSDSVTYVKVKLD
jgi:hypothetical protein